MRHDTTIVITTCDRPQMLPRALNSALAQGANVIVADDGQAPSDYASIRTHGVGHIRARMAALELVDTPYVAFLDDDDWLDPDWLAKSRAVDADVVAASFWETDGTKMSEVRLVEASYSRLLSGHNPVNDGARVRTELLRGDVWRPERGTAAMLSLWLALASRGATFGVVEEPCWYHRIHAGQMSANLPPQDATWRAEAIAEYRVPV